MPFKDPGAYGIDTLDDTSVLNPRIIIGGDFVNVFAPAYTTFNVSYSLTDTSGNAAKTIYRIVVIQDSIPPILTLQGVLREFSIL